MVTFSLLLLALGLAADCFAVAIAQGAGKRATDGPAILTHALLLAAAFGLAQGLMPLMGWMVGTAFQEVIAAFDHWVAFALLAFIGGKMIFEGVRSDPPGDEKQLAAGLLPVLGMAVAVSIDAAAAGFTLPAIGAPIIVSALVIGGVSFAATLVGVYVGRVGAETLGSKTEIAGGLILIAIGVKVLVDHQAFG